jgi:hypothetical protein
VTGKRRDCEVLITVDDARSATNDRALRATRTTHTQMSAFDRYHHRDCRSRPIPALAIVFIYTLGLKRRTAANIVIGGAAGCFRSWSAGQPSPDRSRSRPSSCPPSSPHHRRQGSPRLPGRYAGARRLFSAAWT